MAEPRLLKTENLALGDIAIPDRLRPVGEGEVAEMMASVAELGLLTAIGVRRTDEGPVLVYGAHRLEAAKRLGWATIRADVWEMGARQARLAECEENLRRGDLSTLELAIHLAERKAVYEQLHPETKRGVAGGLARQGQQREHVPFAETIAEKRGCSTSLINKLARIGTHLDRHAARDLRLVGRQPTHRELAAISALTPEQQRRAAEMWVAGDVKDGTAAARAAKADRDTPAEAAPVVVDAEAELRRFVAAWLKTSKAGRDMIRAWLADDAAAS